MDFLKKLTEKINSEMVLYSPVIVGKLADGNSISIRPTGGEFPVRYWKGKERSFTFQVSCKHEEGIEAYEMLESIQAYLEGLKSVEGDSILLKIETTTTVNLQEVNDRNEMIFVALFRATIIE